MRKLSGTGLQGYGVVELLARAWQEVQLIKFISMDLKNSPIFVGGLTPFGPRSDAIGGDIVEIAWFKPGFEER